MSDKDSKDLASAEDVALIHGVGPEGEIHVLRKRDERLELGAFRALREGVPITGEVVKLTPRKDFPLLCDVQSELTVPSPAGVAQTDKAAVAARKGPAQVATDEYRKNWDVIWSGPKGQLSN